ncbi:MAG: B12-binding domain-containing radical SAM protein [Elusimicrobia bacterium]|nr:B12-binding domain-containing radical SAM protein [Elusimicrobiota bacterium]
MSRIVLVNPHGYRFIGDASMPLALIYVSIHLHKDHEVVIIDARFDKDWQERLRRELKKSPLCVGVTSMVGKQIASGLEIAKIVKAESDVPVVWGGIHASLLPRQTLEHPYVDMVVCGEGEETFRDLVRALDKREPLDAVAGLWWKSKGGIREGRPRPVLDLDALPDIPYELVDVERHVEKGPFGRSISMMTSRGCPEGCQFCYNTVYNARRWRGFKPWRILKEIRHFTEKYRVQHVLIQDDNFFVDLGRVREFAEGILSQKLGVTWEVIGVHPRILARVDDELLSVLERSGLTGVAVGVESGNQETLDRFGKNYKIPDLVAANKKLAATCIVPTYCYISGWPDETRQDLRQTVDLMFRMKRDNPKMVYGIIRPLICYPGTQIFSYAVSRGFVPPKKLEDWAGFAWFNYLDIDIPWTTREEKKWLIDLYYSTVMMNPEYVYVKSRLFKFFAKLHAPFMKWRVKNLDFRLSILPKVLLFIQRRLM